jgi:hypothetical protein
MDNELIDDLNEEERPIGLRAPWWETMVAKLMSNEGRLNLA